MSKNKKSLNVGVLIVEVTFLVVIVVMVVMTSARGAELASIEDKIEKLTKENRELESEIILNSSLSNASELAVSKGMKSPDNIVYLNKREVAQVR